MRELLSNYETSLEIVLAFDSDGSKNSKQINNKNTIHI